MESMMAYQKT